MDGTDPDELNQELASLEAREALISAERRRLHDQIDYGFASAETLAREREVSHERRQLHQRIDALREILGETAQAAPDPSVSLFGRWSGVSAERTPSGDAAADESEL